MKSFFSDSKSSSKPRADSFQSANYSSSDTQKKRKAENTSAESAGRFGEKLLQEELRRLKGTVINGYISSENLVFDGQNFEIDFLVMIPNFGLVLAEVKYYSGDVYCTDSDQWKQNKKNGSTKETKNASKQVLRTRALLKKLLMSKELCKWTIKPMVIFVHPDARIFKGKGIKRPQTEILKLSMFEGWVNEQVQKNKTVFTREDFESVYKVIKEHEKSYEEMK